ncbi:DUF2155 domain-containing protein [Alphaproteobacteria bacterium]|nr:DUF2155 domain-containing protein [Alphaproteobacteria bacterium]
MKARRRSILKNFVLFGLCTAQPVFAQEGALLQGLDKVTARVSTFEVPQDKPVRFGPLEIVVRTCSKSSPEETPESTAFLEIHNVRPGEERARIFSGWMFASSPALSAMEHPVYDIWIVDCINDDSSASSSTK